MRAPVTTEVQIGVGTTAVSGVTVDLSEGGLRCVLDGPRSLEAPSGPEPGSEGSLIELTWNGERPLRLADGSERTFLEDGDEVVLRGRAGEIELAEVRGRIVAARHPTP